MVKMSTANKKRIADMKAAIRRGKMLKAKRDGERAIPDKILKQLAALNIPTANVFLYEACLEKLMRDA